MKYLMHSICAMILALILLLSCVGCAMEVYACELIENESENFVAEKNDIETRVIQIGQAIYSTQYFSSKKSNLTNKIINIYGIKEESSDLIRKRIRVDSQTGKVIGFSNINPYSNIDGIDKMSDTEIKENVEQLMSDLVDFSQYNEFEIKRPHSSNSIYYLRWQVRRELLCNIEVEVYINSDGEITNYSSTDACPTELSKSFVDINTRNKLIEDKLCEHLGIESIEGIQYEIISEKLSYYNEEKAIIYAVKISNDGFNQYVSFAIF